MKNKIISLILLLSVGLFLVIFFTGRVDRIFVSAKNNSINEYINFKKETAKQLIDKNIKKCNTAYKKIDKKIDNELKSRVKTASEIAKKIYTKYKHKKSKRDIKNRIIDMFILMNLNEDKTKIFIKNYNGDSILGDIKQGVDADGRSIVLEEIQKVRKRKSGYLKSHTIDNGMKKIYVQDLDMYDWFIGTEIYTDVKTNQLKSSLSVELCNTWHNTLDFVTIFDANNTLCLTPKLNQKIIPRILKDDGWHRDKLRFYYVKYYKPFDWSYVYSFDINKFTKNHELDYKKIQNNVNSEMKNMIQLFIVFIIIFFIIKKYLLHNFKL